MKSASRGSSEIGKIKARTRSSYSIQEEELINPLEDEEMVGRSFKNDLFDD